MAQPEGIIVSDQEDKVCKLIRFLYGLKQASKQWHEKFDSIILSYGFQINKFDNCLYHKRFDDRYVLFCLYVNDILILPSDLDLINDLKIFFSYHFYISISLYSIINR